jgi:hypothetical protein
MNNFMNNVMKCHENFHHFMEWFPPGMAPTSSRVGWDVRRRVRYQMTAVAPVNCNLNMLPNLFQISTYNNITHRTIKSDRIIAASCVVCGKLIVAVFFFFRDCCEAEGWCKWYEGRTSSFLFFSEARYDRIFVEIYYVIVMSADNHSPNASRIQDWRVKMQTLSPVWRGFFPSHIPFLYFWPVV